MLSRFRQSRPWKYVAIGLAASGFACLGSLLYLTILFSSTRPRSQHPEIGRVYPLNNHGVVVYLTRGENFAFVLLIVLAVIFLGLFVAVGSFLVKNRPGASVGE